MWIWNALALFASGGSLVLGAVNFQRSRYVQVQEGQTQLRNTLRNDLHRFDHWRIEKSLNQLGTRLPTPDIENELRELAESIALRKGGFVAPTPQQLQTLINTIESTQAAVAKTSEPPTDDIVLQEDYQEAVRSGLTRHFTALRSQIRCVVNGLDAIQTHAMTRRKQIRQFKQLDHPKAS